MIGRRSIVGLCLLCAIAFSAFAAQGASAATKGTTAFTCINSGTGKLWGAHCLASNPGGGATQTWEHVAIAENTTTEIKANTENGTTATPVETRLKSTVAGIATVLKSTLAHGEGTMTNKKDATTGEHYAEGGGTITFTNVTVLEPAGNGCKIFTDTSEGKEGEEGVIHTEPLTATTKGQEDFLKLEGAGAEKIFARFWIKKCNAEFAFLEGTKTVTGSVKGVPSGATTKFSHTETTTQNTLKFGGNKAGIEGQLTLEGRSGPTGAYHPLSATTVETP